MMPLVQRNQGTEKNSDQTHVFETIVLPHRASLHRAALQLTRNPVEAEDLVQKTLIRAFTRWHTFRDPQRGSSTDGTTARAWLRAILYNLFVSDVYRQKRKCGSDISLDELHEDGRIVNRGVPLSPVDVTANPEGVTIAKEECVAIRRAIDRLPKRYRMVIALVAEDGLRYEEVAALLNVPIGTIRSRLYRARKRIQRACPYDV